MCNNSCGCGNNGFEWWIIILILIFCCSGSFGGCGNCGNSWGNGCGNNGCGCDCC